MAIENTWIRVQSYKHDGSLHRCWDRNFVIRDDEDFLVVASSKTKVTEGDGRRWYTHEPAVTFFSKKHWYNVICMFKPEGIHFYCNIASPTLIDKGFAKYIDYDLDIKLFPDGSTRVLDRQEYDKHKQKYHYGSDLDSVLQYTTFRLLDAMREKQFPFQPEAAQLMFDTFKKANEN
jgi:uncharacterized protein